MNVVDEKEREFFFAIFQLATSLSLKLKQNLSKYFSISQTFARYISLP
jgi:hypothetical protein